MSAMRNRPSSSVTAKYGLSRTTIQPRMWVCASHWTSITPVFLIRWLMSTDWSLFGRATLNTVSRSRNPWVLCRTGSAFLMRARPPAITAETRGTNRHLRLSSSKSGARLPRSTPSRYTTVFRTPLPGPTISAWNGLLSPQTSRSLRTASGSPTTGSPVKRTRPARLPASGTGPSTYAPAGTMPAASTRTAGPSQRRSAMGLRLPAGARIDQVVEAEPEALAVAEEPEGKDDREEAPHDELGAGAETEPGV